MTDFTDEFDRKLESVRRARLGSVPHGGMLDAAVYVRDTLDLAFAAAKSLFKDATLEHALAIYDRIEERRIDVAKQGQENDAD
jgi:hypothetical protein